jgi:chromate transporter
MMRTADHDLLTVVISLLTAGFVVCSKRNPLWALAAGTVAGVIAIHFGA